MSELTPLTDEALNTLRGDFAQSGKIGRAHV